MSSSLYVMEHQHDLSSEAGLYIFHPEFFASSDIATPRVMMGLPEELYFAMLEVGYCARRHKIPGPLACTLIDTAQKSLDLWRQDEKAAMRFAAMVLVGPTSLKVSVGQLPEPVAAACWRLIQLLEYLSTLHDGLAPGENVLQP